MEYLSVSGDLRSGGFTVIDAVVCMRSALDSLACSPECPGSSRSQVYTMSDYTAIY